MPLHISRILHAGYLFESEGTRIAFDPIFENPFSRNCHAFPAVRFDHEQIRRQRFDAVFISHFHDDHCSLESLDLLDRATPIHLYCLFEELFEMVRALGFDDVRPLRLDTAVRVGPFTVTPRIAMEPDVDSMFQVEAGGLKVLNVVDSWIDPDTLPALAGHGPWDMVLWPFQTMREIEVLSPSRASPAPAQLPAEWIAQLQALNPRHVVPSSCQFLQEPWSWYNHAFFPISYRQFQAEVEAALPDARVVRMNPSVSLRLDRDGLTPAASLGWVLPVGEQEVDYAYDPLALPPPTGEIARHFPALDAAQAGRVAAYCRTGLLDKYRAMELPEESYFEQPRLWRLSVFDHEGTRTDWHYRVEGDGIEPVAADAGSLSWTTEIPAAKLYAALELGESLTSMYMRINDQRFDAATELDLETAELVDDPLIRCLFNDAFGAYQAAQLRRLKAKNT
jgi:L-ascorbate metabolism protein UlaG (beta-lactamase superfamily)